MGSLTKSGSDQRELVEVKPTELSETVRGIDAAEPPLTPGATGRRACVPRAGRRARPEKTSANQLCGYRPVAETPTHTRFGRLPERTAPTGSKHRAVALGDRGELQGAADRRPARQVKERFYAPTAASQNRSLLARG